MAKGDGVQRPQSKRPFALRAVIKVAKGLFKSAVYMATVLFKCMAGVFGLLYRCVGSKY